MMNPFRCALILCTFCPYSVGFVERLSADEQPNDDRPNFVLIFIDDMGYGDIEPFGSTANETPNLNQMAEDGMKLTSFYAAPVCSASRAQLLTGSYAPRVSVPGVFFPAGPHGLNPGEVTVAEYLKELGYDTTCIGKWHLGDQPEFLPTNQGFDHYFGIPYSNDMQRNSAVDGRRVTPLLRDGKVAELLEDEDQRRITREYTKEAVEFITAERDKPFFLYMPHTAMHIPLFPHQDFVGKSKNGTYGDWVAEVDWSVGEVLKAIKETGLDESTLVIFTSDNGPWASKGDAGGESGPLRGSKGGTLEGGVREPTICRWPGKISAVVTSDAIAGTTDVLPTLVSLAGGKLRAEIKIDGHDISPLLLGKTAQSPKQAWHYYKGTELKAVRSGAWKLALSPQSLGMGIKDKPADLQVRSQRLYNLDDDISETKDVAKDHPDVVKKLQEIADAMVADIGSRSIGPGVRPPGKNDNPVTLYPTEPRRPRKPNKETASGQSKNLPRRSGSEAPRVANRTFSISCQLAKRFGQSGNGVIVAHGGSAIGYGVYATSKRITFTIRETTAKISRVSVDRPSGLVTLSASLDESGKMSLTVNHEQADHTLGGLLSRQPQEEFCVGHDSANPVDPAADNSLFSGSIKKLSVTTGKANR